MEVCYLHHIINAAWLNLDLKGSRAESNSWTQSWKKNVRETGASV